MGFHFVFLLMVGLGGLVEAASLNTDVTTSPKASKFGLNDVTEFQRVQAEGEVRVYCPVRGVVFHYCNEDRLDPFNESYFYAGSGVAGDELKLSAVVDREGEGKPITKKVKYNAKKEKTRYPVNLWFRSLVQEPLLRIGQNRVSYELTQSGQPVSSGQINVSVSDGRRVECPSETYYPPSEAMCDYPIIFCQRFITDCLAR
jgi:hypothetical protein